MHYPRSGFYGIDKKNHRPLLDTGAGINMKILHIITDTELGGAQTVCISLANMASDKGNTVAVASMDGGKAGTLGSLAGFKYRKKIIYTVPELYLVSSYLRLHDQFRGNVYA